MSVKPTTCAVAALTLLAGSAATVNAQVFQRAIGIPSPERHFSIANTRDGGSITVGVRATDFEGEQVHIVKYDAFGVIDWERTFGGEGPDIAYSVQQTEDGGYIIAGESKSFSPAAAPVPFEIVLLRLDAAGGFVWANAYPGTFMTDPIHTPAPGVALDQAPDGRIFVVGNNAGLATLLSVDPAGALVLATTYADPFGPQEGSQFAFTDVEFDPSDEFGVDDGSVVISGTTRYVDFDNPNPHGADNRRQDAFLFRAASRGAPLSPLHLFDWPDDFSNPDLPNVWETGDGLDRLPEGTIVLAGRTDFGLRGGPSGTHLVHVDPTFTPFWGRDFATMTPNGERASVQTAYAAVEYDPFRDLFIQAGRVDNADSFNAQMQATDLSGAPLWAFAYGANLFARGESIQPKETCGYAMTGTVRSTAAAGDVYLVKTADDGKSGYLERELAPEPIADPFCLERNVVSQRRREFIQLPDVLRVSDSNNTAFCFDDACPGEPMGCNDADLAAPFGVLDIADVVAFLGAFGAMDPAADLAAPFGTWDIADVVAFLGLFGRGCP